MLSLVDNDIQLTCTVRSEPLSPTGGHNLEPRISIITLGVSDIGRATRFYRDGLGFPVHEEGGESITFFALHDLLLALYPRDALAADIGQPDQPGAPTAGVARIHDRAQRGHPRRGGLRAARGRDGRGAPRQARR